VVVVGGGHNALTAAAYLGACGPAGPGAGAGRARRGSGGVRGPVPGRRRRLSRYSYLVSLLPRQIVDDLGLDVRLARRSVTSYTPDPADPARGLLVTDDPEATRRSFARVGAAADHPGWATLYAGTARLAAAVFPTLTRPLPTRAELRERVGRRGLDRVRRAPAGDHDHASLRSDLVRGVAATDRADRHAHRARRPVTAREPVLPLPRDRQRDRSAGTCPVGGMGTVTDALERAARRAGARIVTGPR
jgi:phytoene dehydrogenase-like protein